MPVKKGFGELIDLTPVKVAGNTITVTQLSDITENHDRPTLPVSQAGGGAVPVIVESIDEDNIIDSISSVETFHSTIFDSFNLRTSASYNFYETTETTEFPDKNQTLQETSRYITISWRPTPIKEKILKTYDRDGHTFPVSSNDITVSSNSLSNGFVSPGVLTAIVESPTKQQVKKTIRFIDPGIVGSITNQDRVEKAKKAEHLSSILGLASIIPGLEMVSEVNQNTRPTVKPPEFRSPSGIVGVTYTGYIIEKYDVTDGSMKFISSFEISSPETSSLIDKEILYGHKYAYRIRSIIRWTRDSNKGFFGLDVTDRITKFSQFSGPLDKISSFYGGDWSSYSTVEVADLVLPEHPDEFRVDVPASNDRFAISWKIPLDSQRDISKIIVLKKISTPRDPGTWEEFFISDRSNGQIFEQDLLTFEDPSATITFSSICKTVHGEASVLSEQYTCSVFAGKLISKLTSLSGSPAPINKQKPIVAKKKIEITVQNGYSKNTIFDSTRIIRLTSLATGQRIDLSVDVSAVDIGNRSEVKTRGVGPTLSKLKGT